MELVFLDVALSQAATAKTGDDRRVLERYISAAWLKLIPSFLENPF